MFGNLQHPSCQYGPNHQSFPRLWQDAATSPTPASYQGQGLESILGKATQHITKASPASPMGEEAFNSEATIFTSDTNLCVQYSLPTYKTT